MALRRGPLGARVDDVDTTDVAPTGGFHNFRATS
jgi:hypothetical protein